MFGKKKLALENERLKARVDYLEHLLCPCQQHDYVNLGFTLVGGTGHADETTVYKYECRRCGKRIMTPERISRRTDDGDTEPV